MESLEVVCASSQLNVVGNGPPVGWSPTPGHVRWYGGHKENQKANQQINHTSKSTGKHPSLTPKLNPKESQPQRIYQASSSTWRRTSLQIYPRNRRCTREIALQFYLYEVRSTCSVWSHWAREMGDHLRFRYSSTA